MGGSRSKAVVRAAAIAGAIAVTSYGPRAQAQVISGFAVDTFDPSPRGSQWFVLDSLDIRDDSRGAVGVVAEYGYKPFVIKNQDGTDRAAVVEDQLFLHPGGSLVILDRLRLSVDLPIAVFNSGTASAFSGYSFSAPNQAALGDTAFAADLRLFGRYGEILTGALGLEAIAPTGSRTQYTGDGKTRIVPRLQFAGTFKDMSWALRAGILFRTEDDPIAGQTRGDAFVFGGAIGWRPNHGPLVVGPEIYGSASLTEPSAANTPIEAIVGAHYAFAREWRVNLGVGPGLSSGIGAPLLRTALSLEFAAEAAEDRPRKVVHHHEASDRDHDSIPDTVDACPDQPGAPNIDAALNGCPPPPDRDNDGIADDVDACPDEKGSPSADLDLNGCAPDADDDGVPDAVDACPLRAGVEQADKTQNGCPPDSDRDGIIDVEDACPDTRGVASKDPLDNGCPFDPDRDHDGIPNEEDACPHEAGQKDADPKKNGCPKAILRGHEIRILEQVRFEGNSARIAKGRGGKPPSDSSDVLGAIAKVLLDHPEIKKVEIQGYTDNHGDPKANKRLSEQRAQAVVKWLVGQGLDASRFSAAGYGDEHPIDSNATDEGRQANRRIELHATEVDEPAKAAPPSAPASGEKKP